MPQRREAPISQERASLDRSRRPQQYAGKKTRRKCGGDLCRDSGADQPERFRKDLTDDPGALRAQRDANTNLLRTSVTE